jgi:hypothetical protein
MIENDARARRAAVAVLAACLLSASPAGALGPPPAAKVAVEKLGPKLAKAVLDGAFSPGEAARIEDALGVEKRGAMTGHQREAQARADKIAAAKRPAYREVILAPYEKARKDLDAMIAEAARAAALPPGGKNDTARRAAYERALGDDGLAARALRLQDALFGAHGEAGSLFDAYAGKILWIDEVDVYEHRATLDAVAQDYRREIAEALLLDALARRDLAGPGKRGPLGRADLAPGEAEYERVAGGLRVLTEEIDRDVDGQVKIALHHRWSGGYLTAWAQGARDGDAGAREAEADRQKPMPQVFTYARAFGQEAEVSSAQRQPVKIRYDLQNVKSGQYLSGTDEFHVYLSPSKDAWRIVVDEARGGGGADSPSFHLKHVASTRALMSDGSKAGAGRFAQAGKRQKWSIRVPAARAWTDAVAVAVDCEDKVYFFDGRGAYVRFSKVHDEVDPGFPRKVADDFRGLDIPFTTAVGWQDGSILFFRADQSSGQMRYQRWSTRARRAEGPERAVQDDFPELARALPIFDLAFTAGDGKATFMNSAEGTFVRWDVAANKLEATGKIGATWPGVTAGKYKAAFGWGRDAWFVHGDRMDRFDVRAGKLDDAGPTFVPSP